MQIRRLYISPGHNYFGRHEQPAGENPILEMLEIECVAGRGIRGDRFFDFKEDYRGQITFFSAEVFAELCRALDLSAAKPADARRNVLTAEVDLNALIGQKFKIQDVEFEGIQECRPCYWMNSALGPGAEEWLRGRGGLRAKILSDGTLRCSENAA